MPGKPDGKHRDTKKNGPVRKAAKAKQAREDVVRGAFVIDLRSIILKRNR